MQIIRTDFLEQKRTAVHAPIPISVHAPIPISVHAPIPISVHVPMRKRIRIDMKYQLLYGLKILGCKGVTPIILQAVLEYISTEGEMIGGGGPDRYELLLLQLNNYCPRYLKKSKVKIKSFHMMIPSLILERLRHLALFIYKRRLAHLLIYGYSAE